MPELGTKIKKSFRHIDTITAFFVAVLLISNVASTKILDLKILTFDAGTLLFPFAYIIGDILTEVYGYRRSRKVIWLGFISALVMSLVFIIVGKLPAAADWPFQEAYNNILGLSVRIVIASLIAYLAGEFSNAVIMAKLKVKMQGKKLWVRTIGSTLIGEGIDTIIFVLVAFWGILPNSLLLTIIISNYVFKVAVEVLFTPLTYKIVALLKRKEGEDYYDKETNFNPFKLEN
ncbi:MAG: queuosine precursor transporter [Parcubacteria group bacterium]|nr:queuosine precursor transporter [Parcubacteria group bacterium]